MSIEIYYANGWRVHVDGMIYGPFPTKELALFFVSSELEN